MHHIHPDHQGQGQCQRENDCADRPPADVEDVRRGVLQPKDPQRSISAPDADQLTANDISWRGLRAQR